LRTGCWIFNIKNKIHLSSNELDSISRIRKETIKSIVKGGDYFTDGMILRGKYLHLVLLFQALMEDLLKLDGLDPDDVDPNRIYWLVFVGLTEVGLYLFNTGYLEGPGLKEKFSSDANHIYTLCPHKDVVSSADSFLVAVEPKNENLGSGDSSDDYSDSGESSNDISDSDKLSNDGLSSAKPSDNFSDSGGSSDCTSDDGKLNSGLNHKDSDTTSKNIKLH
jgi:hypothetical protein